MIKLSALIAATAIAALAGATTAFAQADDSVNGAWSYKVGSTGTACTVTLSGHGTDGDIASGANCPGGLAEVAHWRLNGGHLELKSASGEIVGVLHKTDAGYTGSQVDGGRKITLTHA